MPPFPNDKSTRRRRNRKRPRNKRSDQYKRTRRTSRIMIPRRKRITFLPVDETNSNSNRRPTNRRLPYSLVVWQVLPRLDNNWESPTKVVGNRHDHHIHHNNSRSNNSHWFRIPTTTATGPTTSTTIRTFDDDHDTSNKEKEDLDLVLRFLLFCHHHKPWLAPPPTNLPLPLYRLLHNDTRIDNGPAKWMHRPLSVWGRPIHHPKEVKDEWDRIVVQQRQKIEEEKTTESWSTTRTTTTTRQSTIEPCQQPKRKMPLTITTTTTTPTEPYRRTMLRLIPLLLPGSSPPPLPWLLRRYP